MAVLSLEFDSNDPDSSYTIALDGDFFIFRLIYNETQSGWYMDLFTEDKLPIMLGRRLVPGLCPLTNSDALKGVLFVEGIAAAGHSLESLGNIVSIIYFEEGTTLQEMYDAGVRL